MSTEQSMEVIRGGDADYPLLEQQQMQNVLALIEENVMGQSFSVLNLPRIRVMAGGVQAFRVETASGEETPRELEGVVTAARTTRVFWRTPYGAGGGSGGKKPPDCTSADGFVGIGDPGGECAVCPYSQFGTAVAADGTPGPGQACKQVQQVLFLLPGSMLPHLLTVPPTSGKAWQHYTLSLLASGSALAAATTRLSVERAQSAGGVAYGRIVFKKGKPLDPLAQKTFEPYHRMMKALLKPAVVDATSYEVVASEEPEPYSE
jgi:hypothetical protein